MFQLYSIFLTLDTPSPTPLEMEFDATGAILQMIFFLILVVGLALFVLKYLLPRLSTHKGFGNTNIKIVGRVPLDAKKALYVVDLPGKRVLLGSSEQQVNLICELGKQE